MFDYKMLELFNPITAPASAIPPFEPAKLKLKSITKPPTLTTPANSVPTLEPKYLIAPDSTFPWDFQLTHHGVI